MGWQYHKLLLWRLALAVGLAVICTTAKAEDTYQKVIIIGWDGAQREHVKEMLARDELPNLAALSKDGTMVDIDIVTGATDTMAGWSQILTGYAPNKTGIYSNHRFQPIPEGYSVFERLENFFGPEQIETAAFIGKIGSLDYDGPKKVPLEEWQEKHQKLDKVSKAKPGLGDLPDVDVVEIEGVKYALVPGEPYFHVQEHVDMFLNGLVENEKVAAMAMKYLEHWKINRFFMFIHFAEPDRSGHKYGENSPQYSDALKLDDYWTGKIIDKLKELKISDKTLVYVTADHGFDEGKMGHSYAPYIFLATNDKKVNHNGTREDIAPTILKRFGVDLSKIEPPLDGIPLDQPSPQKNLPAAQ